MPEEFVPMRDSATAEPTTVLEYEPIAKRSMPPWIYDHYFGAEGDFVNASNVNNVVGFDDFSIRPRVMRDTSSMDFTITLFGETLSIPVIIAPVGNHKRCHPDGELATAAAAAKAGTIMVLSNTSSVSIEELAESRSGRFWFQVYPMRDRSYDENVVQRAEASGYRAIVVTVDNQGYQTRERGTSNMRNALLALSNYQGEKADGKHIASLEEFLEKQQKSMAWSYVEWIKSVTRLPVLIKGIQCAEDARLCVESGADGICVSNHGGHSVDNAVATIHTLPEIAEVVDGRIPILLDGGIRTGGDVIKAMGLGATAVMIGRPTLWGLAVAGEAGVTSVLEIFRREIETAMGLCGQASLTSLTPGLVGRNPQSIRHRRTVRSVTGHD
jgi:4-hydroxymandelate oxidase